MKPTGRPRKPKLQNVINVVYNPVNNDLHVTFSNGAIYTYSGVAPEKFQQMMNSPSRGEYLHKNIKNKHSFTKNMQNFKPIIPKKDK